jgi:hypothetical protein
LLLLPITSQKYNGFYDARAQVAQVQGGSQKNQQIQRPHVRALQAEPRKRKKENKAAPIKAKKQDSTVSRHVPKSAAAETCKENQAL